MFRSRSAISGEVSMRVCCACGWETEGDEDTVVAATQEHGRRLHNMDPTRDQVLAMVFDDSDHQSR